MAPEALLRAVHNPILPHVSEGLAVDAPDLKRELQAKAASEE